MRLKENLSISHVTLKNLSRHLFEPQGYTFNPWDILVPPTMKTFGDGTDGIHGLEGNLPSCSYPTLRLYFEPVLPPSSKGSKTSFLYPF